MAKKIKTTNIEGIEIPPTGIITVEGTHTNFTQDEIEVVGIIEAEKLQKSGWQLIDCHQTSEGKVYKFKKGN